MLHQVQSPKQGDEPSSAQFEAGAGVVGASGQGGNLPAPTSATSHEKQWITLYCQNTASQTACVSLLWIAHSTKLSQESKFQKAR